VTPLLLNTKPGWFLYKGRVEELDTKFPVAPDEVLYPPTLDQVEKNEEVFDEFLDRVKSLGVHPAAYNEFKEANISMKEATQYTLGPGGERILFSTGWTVGHPESTFGTPIKASSFLFYADTENNILSMVNGGRIYAYQGIMEGVGYIEDHGLITRKALIELRKAVNDLLRETEYPSPYSQRRLARRI
jgi:hypothetical protein